MSLDDEFDKIGGPLQKPVVRKKAAHPPKAEPDATAVTPTARIGLADRLDALMNWTDPFPYRPRPVSPPNPHVPPIDPDAKERAIRASQKPITDDEIAASKMGKNTAR
jgi:hypothetical protein